MMVYAGEKLGPPSANVPPGSPAQALAGAGIRVIVGTDSSQMQEYLDQNVTGPLSITTVTGDVVSLLAADGSAVAFNLQTDTFG